MDGEAFSFGQAFMAVYQIGVVISLVLMFKQMTADIERGNLIDWQTTCTRLFLALAWFHPVMHILSHHGSRDGQAGRNRVPGALLMVCSIIVSAPLLLDSGEGSSKLSFKPLQNLEKIMAYGLSPQTADTANIELHWGNSTFPLEYFAGKDQIHGAGYIDLQTLRNISRLPLTITSDGEEFKGSSLDLRMRVDKQHSRVRDSIEWMRRREFTNYREIPASRRDSLNRVFSRLIRSNWRSVDDIPFVSDSVFAEHMNTTADGDYIVISGTIGASTFYFSLAVTNEVFAGSPEYPHPSIQWGDLAGYYHPGSRLCIVKCTQSEFESTFGQPIRYTHVSGENRLIPDFEVINFDNKSRLDNRMSYLDKVQFYDHVAEGDYLMVTYRTNDYERVFYVDLNVRTRARGVPPRVSVQWGDFSFSRFNHLKLPVAAFQDLGKEPFRFVHDDDSSVTSLDFHSITWMPMHSDPRECEAHPEDSSCTIAAFGAEARNGDRLVITGLMSEDHHYVDLTIDLE